MKLEGEFLSTTQIMQRCVAGSLMAKLDVKRFAQALRQLGFEFKHTHHGNGFRVVELDAQQQAFDQRARNTETNGKGGAAGSNGSQNN